MGFMNKRDAVVTIPTATAVLTIGAPDVLREWQDGAGSDSGGTPVTLPAGRTRQRLGELVPQLADAAGALSAVVVPRHRGAGAAGVASAGVATSGAGALVAGLSPHVVVAQALSMVVAESLGQVRESLEGLTGRADELLRRIEADRLGDIYARNASLRRLVAQVEAGHRLPTADWEAVAPLGVDFEVGVEKLRRYLLISVRGLDARARPSQRAAEIEQLVGPGRLVDHLRLLVVAEETLALYQRLRLERVLDTEPEVAEQVATSAQDILAEAVAQDARLAELLRQVVAEVTVVSAAQGWDVWGRRRLDDVRAQLVDHIDEFVAHRGVQAQDWQVEESAGVREAFDHYRRRARQLTARGLEGLARRIDAPDSAKRPGAS